LAPLGLGYHAPPPCCTPPPLAENPGGGTTGGDNRGGMVFFIFCMAIKIPFFSQRKIRGHIICDVHLCLWAGVVGVLKTKCLPPVCHASPLCTPTLWQKKRVQQGGMKDKFFVVKLLFFFKKSSDFLQTPQPAYRGAQSRRSFSSWYTKSAVICV